ncbi:F-box/kelch-repeat protein At3g23880-like [Vicia villosa]|uniref:F-box/kelch-repeat protein At3g23880-like n=1 Tax=Vicia villosa TaxID=3911 RepID=UPI00273ADF51|nr:F-box/kelch-repeat protein At3g23880-like [Vicia villosa]
MSSEKLRRAEGDSLCSRMFPQNGIFLPEEVILKILLSLPVRSILQFKSVCKLWKTLISDPGFVKSHLQTSTHKLLVSLVQSEEPYKILSYPVKSLFENQLSTPVEPDSFTFLENPSPPIKHDSLSMIDRYIIIDSCNGLLCLFDTTLNSVIMCNPSTRMMSEMSPSAIGEGFEYLYITHYGFGYDQVNDKYKFLAARSNGYGIKIYTFGQGYWTAAQYFSREPRRLLGKYVSGTLNWLADDGSYTFAQTEILSFDLDKETYRIVPLPQNDIRNMCLPLLYVLNDCLCVFFETSKTSWEMWLMKEYGVVESWTRFTIVPHQRPTMRPSYVDPLIISENGVVLLVNTVTRKLSLYNSISGGSDFDYPLISTTVGYYRHICRDSLVSPLRTLYQHRNMS